jgi:hypothetical protein
MLTIDVIDLRRPEEKHDEEVAATQECDEEDHDYSPLRLAEQRRWHHWVWSVELPNEEGDDEHQAKDQRREVVRAAPCVLQIISRVMHVRVAVIHTCAAPHCRPIMKRVMPMVLSMPPM